MLHAVIATILEWCEIWWYSTYGSSHKVYYGTSLHLLSGARLIGCACVPGLNHMVRTGACSIGVCTHEINSTHSA